MKTDDLVAMLSTNVEPIGRGLVGRTISIAVAAGAVIALGCTLAALGIRADLTTTRAAVFLLSKVAFALAVVGVAVRYLTRLARPGAERGISPLSIVLPFAAIALFGAISLGSAPSRCRSHCGRRERNGLRAALHRRFIAVRCGLVRRHDCAVHLGWRSIGTAAIALVRDVLHVSVSL